MEIHWYLRNILWSFCVVNAKQVWFLIWKYRYGHVVVPSVRSRRQGGRGWRLQSFLVISKSAPASLCRGYTHTYLYRSMHSVYCTLYTHGVRHFIEWQSAGTHVWAQVICLIGGHLTNRKLFKYSRCGDPDPRPCVQASPRLSAHRLVIEVQIVQVNWHCST